MTPESFFNQFHNLEKTGAFQQARTLDRIREILGRVGNPHRRLPGVVVVAGSKGKGSTSHLIASILGAAGLKTGLYTSPHIVRWNERIVAEGAQITDEEAAAWIARHADAFLSPTSNGERATYFEVMTAMAFLHFADRELEAVVLEVGLGGTYDAVNVSDAQVAVITQLGLEHQGVLGETLAQIAAEKAGVLKRGQVAVFEHQPIEAMAVLWAAAEQAGALHVDAGLWSIQEDEMGRDFQQFFLTRGEESLGPLRLRLLGAHQLRNARLAVMGALAFCEKTARVLPDEAIVRGLFGVKVPVRMELIGGGPDGVNWLLDGAHNRESAAALAAAIRRHFAGWPVRLAVGMMRDKQPDAFLKELAVLKPVEVVAVGVRSDRAWAPAELTERWKAVGIPSREAQDWSQAAELLKGSSRSGELLVVTGSLYLAGEARKAILST